MHSRLIVRARRDLSRLDTSAMSAPHAGLNAALPMSSTVLPRAIPARLGRATKRIEESVFARPLTIRTSFWLTLSDSQPNSGPENITPRVEAVYTTPVTASLRPAYCVARIGSRPRSICAVPLISVPRTMYESMTPDDVDPVTFCPGAPVPGSARTGSGRGPDDSLVVLLSWTYRPTMNTGRIDNTNATMKANE